jgi:hypothetical protein
MPARLRGFHRQFREFLYRGRHEDALRAQVRNAGTASPRERLDVYRHAYFIRLEKALAHDFPVTETVLGKSSFARCAGDYILAHPSRSPSLRELGHAFANWLCTHHSREFADLAAIEWAAMNVFDAANVDAVGPDRLQVFSPEDWPQLHIELMPTLTLLPLTSNADRVWLHKGCDTELKSDSPRHIAVWRGADYRPMLTEINTDTFVVLNAVAEAGQLSAASERLADELPPAAIPQAIARALHRALGYGWIAAIEGGA